MFGPIYHKKIEIMKYIITAFLLFSSIIGYSQQQKFIIYPEQTKTISISNNDNLLLVLDTSFTLPTKYRINEVFFNSTASYYSTDSIKKMVIDRLKPQLLAFEFSKKDDIVPYIINKGLLETDTIYSLFLLKNIASVEENNNYLKVNSIFFELLKKEILHSNYSNSKTLLLDSLFSDTTSLLNAIIKLGLLKNDTIYSQLLERNIIEYADSLDIFVKQSNFTINSKLIKADNILSLKDSVLLSFQHTEGQDSIILTYDGKNLLIIKRDSSNILSSLFAFIKNNLIVSIIIVVILFFIVLFFIFRKRIKNYQKYWQEIKKAEAISDEKKNELPKKLEFYENAYKILPKYKKAKDGIAKTKETYYKYLVDVANTTQEHDIEKKLDLFKKALKYKPFNKDSLDAIKDIENKLEKEIEKTLELLYKDFNGIINKYYGLECKKISEDERINIKKKIDTITNYQSLLNFEEKKEYIKNLSKPEYHQKTENIAEMIRVANSNLQFFEATPETLKLSEELEKLDLKNNFSTSFENCQNIIKSTELNPKNYKLNETLSYFDKENLNKVAIDFIKKYNDNIVENLYFFIDNRQKFDSFLSKFKTNKIIETIAKYSNNTNENVKKQLETISNNKNNKDVIEILKKFKKDILALSEEAFEIKFDTIQKRNSLIEKGETNYESKNWDIAYDTFTEIQNRDKDIDEKIEICKRNIVEESENFITKIVKLSNNEEIDCSKIDVFIKRNTKYNFVNYDFVVDSNKLKELKEITSIELFTEFYNKEFINDVIMKIMNFYNSLSEMDKKEFNNQENQKKLVFVHEIFKKLNVYDRLITKINSFTNE